MSRPSTVCHGVWQSTAILLTLVLAFPVHGQPVLSPAYGPTAESVARMSLEELLQQKVTIASLAAESFIEAPSSVTVFTREEIVNMGVRTLEDLLNFVPGMQAGRAGGQTSYSVTTRGRNPSQVPNNTLVLINGYRLNEDLTGSALVFDRFISLGNVERVEVIRGPGSALYGSNAFLSVVNLVTATDLSQAEAYYGSFDSKDAMLNVSADMRDLRVSAFVHAFDDDGDEFVDVTHPDRRLMRDPRAGLNAYATLELDRLRVDVRHSWFEVDDFYMFSLTPSDPINHYESRDTWVHGALKLLEADRASLVLSGGYRWIEGDALAFAQSAEQMARFPGGADAPFLGGPVVELSEAFVSADGAFDWGEAHEINAGLSFRQPKFDKLRNQNNYETADIIEMIVSGRPQQLTYYGEVVETSDFGPSGSTREILGLYVQDRYAISDATKLTAGLRADHYSDFGWTLNPRLGLVHTASEDTTVKLMYGEAFRAPTVNELSDVSPTVIGNPDLDPERVRTLELAWLQNFDRLETILTGYFSRIEDRIDRAPAPDGSPRTTYVNGGSEDLTGIELEAFADITRDLFLRGSYSHLFDIASPPSRASRNLASLVLNYALGDWNLNLNGYYHGEVQATSVNEEDLPAYWMMNGNVRYDLGPVTLVGSVYNLLDADANMFTQAPIPGGVPSRGRAFRVGLEVDF